MTGLPRMRTIDAAIAQLHKDDPDTCFTRHALRRMILEGRIKSIRAGTKYLLDYNHLIAVLNGGPPVLTHKRDSTEIKRIDFKNT